MAAMVEGKIYVIGGFWSANYVYDPSTDNWTARTPLPPCSFITSVVPYHNKIYCISDSNTEVYDIATDSWVAKTPMPISTLGLANIVDGQIYVISGYNSSSRTTQLLDITQVYNIATDSWTTKAPIPHPVSGYASTVCDGKIYILGGQDPSLDPMNVNFTQIYDPSTDSWSFGAPMPTTVLDAAACATTGIMAPENIYLFGGYGSQSSGVRVSSFTQVYNPKNNSWSYGAPMLSPRVDLAVANVNDALFVLGGSNTGLGGPYTRNNEEYLPFGYSPTAQAATDNGSTVGLEVSGNITITQLSNVTISTDQSAMTANITFTLNGETGTVGFGNITIPINAIPNGTVPTVYIDNQLTEDQGYTQDNENYYVWFTAHFSRHQISIVFAQNETPVDFGWVQVAILGLIGAVAIVVVFSAVVFLTKRSARVNSKASSP